MDQVNAQATQPVGNGFPYAHLPQGQIRLLTISENAAGVLTLSLEHHVYGSDLVYSALSYAWGDPKDSSCTVLCNEHSLRLSVHLLEALKSLKALEIEQKFWIDYICIDQSNNEDKSWQLRRMAQYYSQAREVWVWLGIPHDHDALAMKAMSDLAAKLPILESVQPITDDWLRRFGLPTKYDTVWEAIDNIFTRKWFDRLWTMQEFALAATTQFFCGALSISGTDIACVVENLQRLNLTVLTRSSRIPKVGYKDGYHFYTFAKRYWEAKRRNDSMTLDLALQLGRFKESAGTNEYDRVYAVLGVLDSKIRDQIDIGYLKPYSKMYIDVGKVSLQTSSHLEILAQCQSQVRPPDLPTWCPDWNSQNEATPFLYDYYFAGFKPGMLSKSHTEFPSGTNNLLIEGTCVTTVKDVAVFSEKWDIEPVTMQKFAYTARWINECLEKAKFIVGMPAPIILEAFIRTLIADVFKGQTGHSKEQLEDIWSAAVQLMETLQGNTNAASMELSQKTLAYDFLDSVFNACRFRRFFVTQDLRLALGPDRVRIGDKVVIFRNACMPFILREINDGQVYELLGPAYVRGLMMGQALNATSSNPWEMFEIA